MLDFNGLKVFIIFTGLFVIFITAVWNKLYTV